MDRRKQDGTAIPGIWRRGTSEWASAAVAVAGLLNRDWSKRYPGLMTGANISPRDLRVSDAERTHVLALLEKAIGRGMITLAEYSDRSAVAISARTRSELNVVLVDLPGIFVGGQDLNAMAGTDFHQHGSTIATPPAAPYLPWSQPNSALPAPPGSGVLDLKGYGSRDFSGPWVVPGRITIAGTGASTNLDFSQATLTSPVVIIEFRSNYAGSAVFRVPEGSQISYDQLDLRNCSINNKLNPATRGGKTVLHLVFVGVKRYGSITVKPPKAGLIDGIINSLR